MNDSISSDAPVNPYAPPEAKITPGVAEAPDNAEAIRNEFLKHETSIRSIGLLYLFGAFGGTLGAIAVVIAALADFSSETGPVFLGVGVFYALMAWISYYLGRGLRRLDSNVRTGTTILAVIGLLGIPIGTLINIYILYLIHSEKGKKVMTPEYQAIIAQTPHIKYRTPIWLITVVILLIVLAILGVVAAFNS